MNRIAFATWTLVLFAVAFTQVSVAFTFPNNELESVAVAASGDVWAVGTSSGTSTARGLIEHWDSVSWKVIPSANPGAAIYGFHGVAVASSNDVWAVGYSQASAGAPFQTLIERWNGSAWSVVSSPNRSANISSLFAVTVISSTNVWTVGYSGDQNTVTYQTLVEHWNGNQWQIVASPNSGISTMLTGVSGTSANDIWAAGWFTQARGNRTQLTEHWNGSAWSVVAGVNRGGSEARRGILALASNNAWSTGPNLTEQWNGSSWSLVMTPSVYNILTGLTANSASDIWAVGREYINTSNTYITLVERWNGSQWSIVTSPSPGVGFNALYGGAVASPNDVWAVGTFADSSGNEQTLAEHWNGSNWSVVPTP